MEPPMPLGELAKNPLPDNVVTGCVYNADYDESYDNFDPGLDWTMLAAKNSYQVSLRVYSLFPQAGTFTWHMPDRPPLPPLP